MSKAAKVTMMDILIMSGYTIRKSFILCKVPLPVKLSVYADAVDFHRVEIVNNAESMRHRMDSGSQTYSIEESPIPIITFVESSVVHDSVDDWSMSRSRIEVTYPESTLSLYFGEVGGGNEDDPVVPLTHRISIPLPHGWPEPESLIAQYPAPTT